MIVEKKNLKEIINAVDTTKLTEEGSKTLDLLEHCIFSLHTNHLDSKDNTTVNLANLNLCRAYTLWSADDIYDELTTFLGDKDIEDFIAGLDEDDLDNFVADVNDVIDWTGPSFADESSGFDAINLAIERIAKERIAKCR